MKKHENNGDKLTAYFLQAITNIITSENAKVTAQDSEQQLLGRMNYASGSDLYTSAQDLSLVNVNKLARDSLNAHLEKIQSQQIEEFVNKQTADLNSDVNKKYSGKKVVVTKIPDYKEQFEAVYVDSNNRLRYSNFSPSVIKGKIYDISLDKNIILIKPNILSRKLTPNRVMFRVNVINLETLQPQVKLNL